MAGEGELEKEWKRLSGCSIALISSSLCLSVVLPLGVMFGGTSFAGWWNESTPGAARWRAELWICRGFEDCFEAADDVNVRRRAAFWATGRAVGTAAMRRQRVQMFLEAMVCYMFLHQARLRNCDWTCRCAIDVSMCPKEMVCPPRVRLRTRQDDRRQAPRLERHLRPRFRGLRSLRPRRLEDRVSLVLCIHLHCINQQPHLPLLDSEKSHDTGAWRGIHTP